MRGSVRRPLDALRGKATGTQAQIRRSGQTQEHESERRQPGEHTQRRQRSGNQVRWNRIERYLTAHRQNQRSAPQGRHNRRGEHFRAEHRHDAHEQTNQRRTQQNQRGGCRHRQGEPHIHGEVRGGKQTHQHRGLKRRQGLATRTAQHRVSTEQTHGEGTNHGTLRVQQHRVGEHRRNPAQHHDAVRNGEGAQPVHERRQGVGVWRGRLLRLGGLLRVGRLLRMGGAPGVRGAARTSRASPPQPLHPGTEQQVCAGKAVRANRQHQPVRTQKHNGNIRPGHRRNMAESAELILLPRGGTHQRIIPVGGTQNQCRRLRAEGVQGAGAQLLLDRGQVRLLRHPGGSVRSSTGGGRGKNSRAAQLRRGTVKLHRAEGGHLHVRINCLRARSTAPLLLSRRARRRTCLQTLRGTLCRTVTPVHAYPLIHQRTHAPPLNFLQLNNHQSSARIHAANLLHRAIQTKRGTLRLLQRGAGCIHPRSAQKHRLNRDNTRQKNQLTGRAKEQAVGHHRTRRKEQQNRQTPQQSNEHTRQRMHHPPRAHG